MRTALNNAKRQIDKLKKDSSVGSIITVDLTLDFSGFEGCTDNDNIHIPLRCTRNDALLLKRRQEYSNNGPLPLSD